MAYADISRLSQKFLATYAHAVEKHAACTAHILSADALNVLVPDFDSALQWLNTSESLSFDGNLKGKICILDFFTYCCINCMHILPDLHILEEKFPVNKGVAVVGVHSAKFENEKVSSNILNAILRYDISHPVVNDQNARLWNEMDIQCWPTLVVIGPDSKVLLYLVGEGHRDLLLEFVGAACDYYYKKGSLSFAPLPVKLAKSALPPSVLSYPGKIALSEGGDILAVSDTGHHQIVIVHTSGLLRFRVGRGEAGFKDGGFAEAMFNAPQGLCFRGQFLYVADTENHCIRQINIDEQTVSTVAGTGRQGQDKEGGKPGREQEISSPWDVLISSSPGFEDDAALYIAAAGTHQIWAYFVENGGWFRKSSQPKGTCIRFAGTGNEENRNNSYPQKASFAQPSGLTCRSKSPASKTLYVADSESSSIRCVDINTGSVRGCVGGERDPTNLFAYGDVDGKGVDAKLQHPLGVAYNSHDDCVYFADSYNHKIKRVQTESCVVETVCGTAVPGFQNGPFNEAMFNEPGGLCISKDGSRVYVVDTNNHVVRVVDLQEKFVSTLHVYCPDEVDAVALQSTVKQLTVSHLVTSKNASIAKQPPALRSLNHAVRVKFDVTLEGGAHFTEDADSAWQAWLYDGSKEVYLDGGQLKESRAVEVHLPGSHDRKHVSLKIELLIYFCTADNVCRMKQVILEQTLSDRPDSHNEDVALVYHVKV